MGFGAFAGGLANGINNGMRMSMMQQQLDQEAERQRMAKEDRDYQKSEREREQNYQNEVGNYIANYLKNQGGNSAPQAAPADNAPQWGPDKTGGFGAMPVPQAESAPSMTGTELPKQSMGGDVQPAAQPAVDPKDPASFFSPSAFGNPKFMQGLAEIAAKNGKANVAIPLLNQLYTAQKEGTVDALKMLVAGNDQAAIERFNQSGQLRADNIKHNDDGTVTVTGGGKTVTFDPEKTLKGFMDTASFFTDARQAKKDKADQDYKNKQLDLEGRKVALAEKETGARMGLYGAQADYYRAKGAAASGQGAGGGQKMSPYNVQTAYNAIDQHIGKVLGGTFDAMGNLSLPAGQQEKYATLTGLAQEIERRYPGRYSPAELYNLVNSGAKGAVLTDADAVAQATKEADAKAGTFRTDQMDFGMPRDQWVQKRAAEIKANGMRTAVENVSAKIAKGKPAAPSGGSDNPPVAGAQKAPDGNWYVKKGAKYYRVEPDNSGAGDEE